MKKVFVFLLVLFFSSVVFAYGWGYVNSPPGNCSDVCSPKANYCGVLQKDDCTLPISNSIANCVDINGNNGVTCSRSGPYCLDNSGEIVSDELCSCASGKFIPGTVPSSNTCCIATDGSDSRYSYDGHICCNTIGLSKPVACSVNPSTGVVLSPSDLDGVSLCCPTNSTCSSKVLNGSYAPKCVVGGGGLYFPPLFCLDKFGSNIPCGFTEDECKNNLLCADNLVGVRSCNTNLNCPSGQICVEGSCVFSGGAGDFCYTDNDCSVNNFCKNNVCNPSTLCTPLKCSEIPATCGTYSDGCGSVISCGTCGVDNSCYQGSCVSQGEGVCNMFFGEGACGLNILFDPIYCGGCDAGFVCESLGQTGVCIESPSTCSPSCSSGQECIDGTCTSLIPCQENQCGFVSSGGSSVNYCGVCSEGNICSKNNCVPICDPSTPNCAPACTPKSTCGVNECGIINDGCGGQINCGVCQNTCTKKTICEENDCGIVSDNCTGTLDCSNNCPIGTKNTIVDLKVSAESKLLVSPKCKLSDTNSKISVYLDGTLIDEFTRVTCSPLGQNIDLGGLSVPKNSLLKVVLNINEPCSTCEKSVFVPFFEKQSEFNVPDNNILSVLVLILCVVFIVFRNKK